MVGEAMAAGTGPFGLSEFWQESSFPALAARRLGIRFHQPILPIDPIAECVGRLPGQCPDGATFVTPDAAAISDRPIHNVSLPGLGFREAVRWQTRSPLVDRDPNRSLFHLTFGLSSLLDGRRSLTPVEMAAAQRPTLALMALGYHEAACGAIAGDPTRIPKPAEVKKDLAQACAILGPSRRILATVPNPLDSAYFVDPSRAAQILDVPLEHVQDRISAEDGLLCLPAIWQWTELTDSQIIEDYRLSCEQVDRLRAAVEELNRVIRAVASRDGAQILDLHALFRELATDGLDTADGRLTSDPFGGFFSISGLYPNAAGQEILAHRLMALIGEAPIGVVPAPAKQIDVRADPVTSGGDSRLLWSAEGDDRAQPTSKGASAVSDESVEVDLAHHQAHLGLTLEASDGSKLFAGPAISFRPVTGNLRLRLSRIDDRRQTFELDFGDGLSVAEGLLAAPLLFTASLPIGRLKGTVTGEINGTDGLATALDGRLELECDFLARWADADDSSCEATNDLRLLMTSQPIDASRPIGRRLDLSVTSRLRIPRQSGPRLPFPFRPSEADVLPLEDLWIGIHLSIRIDDTEKPQRTLDERHADRTGELLELPERTVLPMAAFSHDCRAELTADVVTDPMKGTGRFSQPLTGRLFLITGLRQHGRLPVAIRLSPWDACTGGWLGFPAESRFGSELYPQTPMALWDYPFHQTVTGFDSSSGVAAATVYHRVEDSRRLLVDLRRVESRAHLEAPYHAGEGRLETRPGGELYYHFQQNLPAFSRWILAEGLEFPAAHGQSGFALSRPASLQMELKLSAHLGLAEPTGVMGGEERLLSTTRKLFSYRYLLSTRPADPVVFELTNHTEGGTFLLEHLCEIVFGSSPGSRARKAPDTVSLTGYGSWSTDPEGGSKHQIIAHICRAPSSPFTAIAVDGGRTTSVCTLIDRGPER